MKFLLLTAAMLVHAQTFDVASIKQNPQCSDSLVGRGIPAPSQLAMECADLRDMILTAYGIFPNGSATPPGSARIQVVGGPKWMDSVKYEIFAKTASNLPRAEILGPMLRSLLEDRFHLKVHRETKEGRIYKLIVAKNGPKLRESNANDAATMKEFAARLGSVLDGEVFDTTGLTGKYDVHLDVDPSLLRPRFIAGHDLGGATNLNVEGPSIFTAVQQQLGLKLDSARGPVTTIVIDAIEPPTEN